MDSTRIAAALRDIENGIVRGRGDSTSSYASLKSASSKRRHSFPEAAKENSEESERRSSSDLTSVKSSELEDEEEAKEMFAIAYHLWLDIAHTVHQHVNAEKENKTRKPPKTKERRLRIGSEGDKPLSLQKFAASNSREHRHSLQLINIPWLSKPKSKSSGGPISKTLSYLRNKMDTALSTSQLYPTKDEVRQWETSFEALLNNKQGCALFRQFLKKEFSDENVDFWCACEEFKNIKDPKKLKQKAHEIYKEFVAEQAPKEVNLDSDTRAATKAAIFEEIVKLDTFSLAQSRIEQLMAKDSYRRFLKDRIYLDMLEGFENGTNSNTGSTANLANGNNSPK
ncbi:hypothetical protein WR25_10849 [Diploscapter pachys]|uniref:RGS domain-containing protein n=1 Tax=Diploscapter pachys TaxID=2018661 RepID=A0A2A2LBZ1_9BILA|nr:hypothetical protein WR25_10849 [Diploscapter pachys]